MKKFIGPVAIFFAGHIVHWSALWWVSQLYRAFQATPDPIMDRLPQINFGWYGEALFLLLLALAIWTFFGRQRSDLPQLFTIIGIFYALRGVLLFVHPIGTPLGAIDPSMRLNIWGFADHAYFPGGHVGLMTIFAMHLRSRPWRIAFWVGLTVFASGTILAKTHYTVDTLVGIMLGYAITVWVWRRTDQTHPALNSV